MRRLIARALTCIVLYGASVLATGCAHPSYHSIQWRYEITGLSAQVDDVRLAAVMREFFRSQGLRLDRQYLEASPARSLHLAFTRPAANPGVGRQADLSVAIEAGPIVTLNYAERFPASGAKPKDYLAGIAAELSSELRTQLGEPAAVRFVSGELLTP